MKDYVVFKRPMFHGLFCFTVSLLLFLATPRTSSKFEFILYHKPALSENRIAFRLLSIKCVSFENRTPFSVSVIDVWFDGMKIL